MENNEGIPTDGDGLKAKLDDATKAKPGVEVELVGVQDSVPTNMESKLTVNNQPEWVARIVERWALEEGEVQELMLGLVGGCDDACGVDLPHAHDVMMRTFFRESDPDGEGNAGVSVFMSLVRDIRKETQYFRGERQKLRKAYDVQESTQKAERERLLKDQSAKLEGAADALDKAVMEAKAKAAKVAVMNRKGREELVDQSDRLQRQNNSLSDTIAVHAEKAAKLTTTVEHQALTIAKFKQHVVVTSEGQGQQVATQAALEAMREELRAEMTTVKDELSQQIDSVGQTHMDALEQITYQTAQMVARETGALVDRMEQCIDMNGPPLLMSGEELYREKGPRQALSGALSLEVLVANRVENGTRIFKLATVVEERGKVFIFHAAFALWKRHISSLVLLQMQREMHDLNLSGIQDETRSSSSFWITALRKNRLPNYEGCYTSWRAVDLDHDGNLRRRHLKKLFETPKGRDREVSDPLPQSEPMGCIDSPSKQMFGTLRKEHEIRQKHRRQSDLHEPLVGSAPTSEESEGAATETTADEGGRRI